MVLSLMRRHAKSWLIKFLMAIIAIVFIFYFGYSFTAKQGLKMASVNGEIITGAEYQKAYRELVESLREQYKEYWSDNLIEVFGLKNAALENLINEKLIAREAERLGLSVTEEEVKQAILDTPSFQIDGQFDIGRYHSVLAHNRMEPEDFEATLSQQMVDSKLRQFLFSFMHLGTDQELRDRYSYDNEKVKIGYVQFSPDSFRDGVSVDETTLAGYFDEHKERYRIPEKIKVAYLEVNPDSIEEGIQISDEEVQIYYEYNVDAYTQPKKVRARHILFKLEQGAPEEEEKEVRDKAEKVLKEARQGKDFAALAETHSEGPTKTTGGDLGFFAEGEMVKPFEEAAFEMKKGDISDLVRTSFGYHIIKVEDVQESIKKTPDQVRDEIVTILQGSAKADVARERAQSLLDQMPYDLSLEQYGSEQGFTTETTGFFSRFEPIPGFGEEAKLKESLFSLEKGETSEIVEHAGAFYIFQVTDKKDSALPELEAVAEAVRGDCLEGLIGQEAEAAAEGYLALLKEGKEWEALAQDKGLTPAQSGFFSRKAPLDDIGNVPGLVEAAFGLSEEKPYPDSVFKDRRGSIVIRWEGYQDIDEEDFQLNKAQTRSALVEAKEKRAIGNWIQSLREKAEVKILSPL